MALLKRALYCFGVTIVGGSPFAAPPRNADSFTQLSTFLSHVYVRMKSSLRDGQTTRVKNHSEIRTDDTDYEFILNAVHSHQHRIIHDVQVSQKFAVIPEGTTKNAFAVFSKVEWTLVSSWNAHKQSI